MRSPETVTGSPRRSALSAAGLAVVGVALMSWWGLSQPPSDAGALAPAVPATVSTTGDVPPGTTAPIVVPDPVVPERVVAARSAAPEAVAPAREPVVEPAVLRGAHLPGDVGLVPVGVSDGGAMEIPRSGGQVGWYRFGAAPGDRAGSAVLAGHVDTFGEGPGALAATTSLEVGDSLQVQRADGSLVDYAVTARVLTGKDDLPTEDLFTRTGAPRLVLITCGGGWREDVRSYDSNVVVTAQPLP